MEAFKDQSIRFFFFFHAEYKKQKESKHLKPIKTKVPFCYKKKGNPAPYQLLVYHLRYL